MTLNISRRTALKTAAAAGALSVAGMPAIAAPKHGGTYTIGMSGGNTSDTWDSRTHSDSFMINMGAGCVFETPDRSIVRRRTGRRTCRELGSLA